MHSTRKKTISPMLRSACPNLPAPADRMSYLNLRRIDRTQAPEAFYLEALRYGNYLWQHQHAGRAILAITRALYTKLPDSAPVLEQWPRPYAAIQWIVQNHSSDDFPGNPRVSFQHQATRIQGPSADTQKARAWAVWAIICKARPTLKPDNIEPIQEPSIDEIYKRLASTTTPAEADLWRVLI